MGEAPPPKEIFGETTPEVVARAAAILSEAGHAALATIAPDDGHPQATRVIYGLIGQFTPVIAVSALAAHTGALRADPRCSLLVGEVGKGDPLAYPRLTLKCRAREIARVTTDYAAARRQFLAAQPKAELYIDLPDFTLMALMPEALLLNVGFGKAYRLGPADLVG